MEKIGVLFCLILVSSCSSTNYVVFKEDINSSKIRNFHALGSTFEGTVKEGAICEERFRKGGIAHVSCHFNVSTNKVEIVSKESEKQ